MLNLPEYVVVTPARNEAQYIDLALRSVTAQTVLPRKWVIVSDGSTDGTDEIVLRYAAKHPWIELVRTPERKARDFAGKVYAFNAGFERLSQIDYEVMASLDADISFEAGYFEFLLTQLAANPALGVVGTPLVEGGHQLYDYRFVSIEHVSGGCQVFRRECFADIGGYLPVKGGLIDRIAVTTARMKGWQTRTFPEKVCHHHRVMGTAERSWLRARFRDGLKDYAIGNHPLWEVSRVLYQMTKKPLLFSGLALAAGYTQALAKRMPRPISPELMAFTRREQMQRLRRVLGARRNQAAAPGTRLAAEGAAPLEDRRGA